MRIFWQLRASSTTTSYTIYISAKNHCGAVLLLRLAQIFFSSLSKLQKNCQSDRMRFQKLLPNNLAGVLNEKSNFSLVEYVDISRSLPNYRLPAKLLFKPKRKKFASKLCDFNNLTGQNNFSIDYFILFYFSKWFVFHDNCFIIIRSTML